MNNDEQIIQPIKPTTPKSPTSIITTTARDLRPPHLLPPTQPNIYPHNKLPNYNEKILKVQWHPTLNAVAVAGLYKLYLYQTKLSNDI